MYGLSAYEDRVVATLPAPMRVVVKEALRDPESAAELRYVLRSGNPRAVLQREIMAATREALVEEGIRPAGMADYYDPSFDYIQDAGMGRSLKKSIKKIVKKVVAPIKKVHDKVLDKILPQKAADFLKRSRKKISDTHSRLVAKHKKVMLRYGHIILPVVGLVLAPFTAGLSVVAAGLISGGLKVYKDKEAAEEAVKAQKAEANTLLAQAAQEEANLARQVEGFYNDNQQIFLAFGLIPEAWAKLTLQQKLDVIDALSRGELPEGWDMIQVDDPAAAGAAPQAGSPAAPQLPVAPAPAPAAQNQQYIPPALPAPAPAAPPAIYPSAPPQEAAPVQEKIVIRVNGAEVASASSADDARRLAISSSSPGDRVDIIVGGSTTGLRLRTAAGLMDVPPEAEDRVRAMSVQEARGLAQRAEQKAGGGGFSWWWVLALPAAYFAAKAS